VINVIISGGGIPIRSIFLNDDPEKIAETAVALRLDANPSTPNLESFLVYSRSANLIFITFETAYQAPAYRTGKPNSI